MKRTVSFILTAMLLLLSFQITTFAAEINAEANSDSVKITSDSDIDAVI